MRSLMRTNPRSASLTKHHFSGMALENLMNPRHGKITAIALPITPCVIIWLSFSHERPPMARRLPPLNALKAFEAAARSESFTRAAEELNVTQGAVSHQVKALEEILGVKLFNRERQRLIITEAGREYLAVVRDALDRIAVGTERLVQRQTSGVLTVSTSPDFAAKWLVHRLGRFAEAHPDIDLRVSATIQYVDFAREDVDLAVRHGDGNWPGLDVVRLCSERLFPVCAQSLFRVVTASPKRPIC